MIIGFRHHRAAVLLSCFLLPNDTRRKPKSVSLLMLTAFLVVMVGNSLAQTPTEFWPNSFSSTYISGDLEMQTSFWSAPTNYFSADLLNQPAGEYLIQAFDAPTGVPNSSYLINGN